MLPCAQPRAAAPAMPAYALALALQVSLAMVKKNPICRLGL